jgi:hypothetical protein
MADLLFSKGFLEQISLHAQVSVRPFQPTVLFFHRFHLADHGRICYPAGFCKAKAREGMPPYFARHL